MQTYTNQTQLNNTSIRNPRWISASAENNVRVGTNFFRQQMAGRQVRGLRDATAPAARNLINSEMAHRFAKGIGIGAMGFGALGAFNNMRDGRYGRAAIGAGMAYGGYRLFKDPRIVEQMANKLLNFNTTKGVLSKRIMGSKAAGFAARILRSGL
jgi:hypothetical protein